MQEEEVREEANNDYDFMLSKLDILSFILPFLIILN